MNIKTAYPHTAATMAMPPSYMNANTNVKIKNFGSTEDDGDASLEAFSYGCDIDESNNEYHASESEFERGGGASDYFSESATESLNFASTVATAPSLLSGMSSTNIMNPDSSNNNLHQQPRPKRKKKRGKPKTRNK